MLCECRRDFGLSLGELKYNLNEGYFEKSKLALNAIKFGTSLSGHRLVFYSFRPIPFIANVCKRYIYIPTRYTMLQHWLLMHRCQLYMFRTVTVHPRELLFRCCTCVLLYVVRNALSDTSRWYNVWGRTLFRLYRRLGGPRGRSGRARKISTPPGFAPRTLQFEVRT